jgi:predicted nucleic acid-binding protein
MSSFKVVLDACVLYPASLRDTLLRSAQEGLFRVLLSDQILEEVKRNLVKDTKMSEEGGNKLVAAISQTFEDSIVPISKFAYLIPVMQNQEKDRHVLALAVTELAQVIVTYNLKDFPASILEEKEIQAQSPDDFLLYTFDLNRSKMLEILKRQTLDLKNPPISFDELLTLMSNHVPNFVLKVKEYISNLEMR